MWQRRLWSALFAVFAALALLLAASGMYAVMSYLVGQQMWEIGIRMALGAAPRRVLTMVMRRSMLLVGAGVALGLAASLALGRGMRTLLFGVAPFDPAVVGIVVALLVTSALAACCVPGRRAANVDPVIALRHE
jgi:putative ABC transport system permease protein